MAPISPILAGLSTYPFVRLEEAKRAARARGIELVDFGVGDPHEGAPAFVREALVAALDGVGGYPLAQGLPELRAAVAAWCRRRFGVDLDPDREVIPTLGSKEAIFSLAQIVLDPPGGRDVVVVTEPGYPVPERGALFAGGRPHVLPLLEENGFLPDLESLDEHTWRRVALFWVNYPNNPTGATAPLAFYEELALRAREYGFVLASDEAYTEVWFDGPPASALQLADRGNVIAFNTLSKRSGMTGYRSGFAAGDPALVAALRAYRPTVGTAPQEFVQRAAIAAWSDEGHVEAMRARYGERRAVLLDVLERKRLRVPGSRATLYLWLAVPNGEASEDFSARLLEHGVVVSPGPYFGAAGEGYVRLALVPPLDDCRRAADVLEELL
ncbi:MAG: aminotransferase class I/II-fold pyridoxal phosphate-dependent enzyme [Thermoleophilia bacterium]|nr:aminotransferase class I/II-fold pyridoxal phosphate-dependent enzyme [Thermoleophilia bacterium]